MYSTQVYYYTPRQTVVVFVGTSTRRYNTVYAKNLKLHKGVDNKIQFQFLNQEQKPVDITNKEILCRIISYDGTTVLLQKLLTLQLPLTGLALLEVSASELLDIDAQLCGYSLEVPEGTFEYPVFVNSEAGGRGVIEICNSILPPFLPSSEITIPSHPFPNANANTTVTFYSSTFGTYEKSRTTIQSSYVEYIGNIQVQGSTIPDGDWYDIGSLTTYTGNTVTQGQNIDGFHPYVRLKFMSTGGNVASILIR